MKYNNQCAGLEYMQAGHSYSRELGTRRKGVGQAALAAVLAVRVEGHEDTRTALGVL